MASLRNNFLILAFLSVVALVIVQGFLDHKTEDANEKRSLKEFPVFADLKIRDYSRELSEYFNDHFGFREEFINLNKEIKIELFKQGLTHKVIKGKDGNLFYKASVGFYEGDFNRSKSEEYVSRLESFAAKNDDKEIYFILVPNKAFANAKYLPDWVKRSDLRDNIVESLSVIENIKFLDLYDVFNQQGGVEYLKYDTHWGAKVAFNAYEIIINFMNNNSSTHYPVSSDIIKTTEIKAVRTDLAKMLGEEDSLKEADHVIELNEVTKSSDKKLVLVSDSFFDKDLHTYFSHSFSNIIRSETRVFEKLQGLVDQENPEMVVFIVADRHIKHK